MIVHSVTETCESGKFPLQLSYVIVEDGVGPYDHTNYYAGGGRGEMAGWENKTNPVSTVYDDVARHLDGFPGILNSLPEEFEAGKEYDNVRSLPLKNVSGAAFRVIGLVIDKNTKEILNACQVEMTKSCGAGVIQTFVNDNSFEVVDGKITSGNKDLQVYSLDGRLIRSEHLTPGIYIVIINGNSHKVCVR